MPGRPIKQCAEKSTICVQGKASSAAMAAEASEQSFLYQAEWQIVETAQQNSADRTAAQLRTGHGLTIRLADSGHVLLTRTSGTRSHAKTLSDIGLPQAEHLQLSGYSPAATGEHPANPAAAGPAQAAALLQALQHFTASSKGLQHVALRTEGSSGNFQAGHQPAGCAQHLLSAIGCDDNAV